MFIKTLPSLVVMTFVGNALIKPLVCGVMRHAAQAETPTEAAE